MGKSSDRRALSLGFPLGGLDKSRSYQTQAPFTTPACSNVWLRGSTEGRARGGSRPGLQRIVTPLQSSPLAVGNFTFITEVSYVPSAGTARIRRLVLGTKDGRVWRQREGGAFAVVVNETPPSNALNTASVRTWTAELFGKVYIADTGPTGPYVYDPNIDVDTSDRASNDSGNPLFPWGSSTVVSTSGTAPTTVDIDGRMTFALSGTSGNRKITTTIVANMNLQNAGVVIGDKLMITIDPRTAGNVARDLIEAALKDAFDTGVIETIRAPYYGPRLHGPLTISGKVTAISGNVVQVATDFTILNATYDALIAGFRWDVTLHVFIAGTTIENVTTVTKGNVPPGNHLIVRWRERLVLAGAPSHMWYMSSQGDPEDFDFSRPYDDPSRAVAGISNQDLSGSIGDDITAMIPFGDESLLFGAKNSIWVMRGDPAAGGSILSLDNTVGVLDQGSWCYGPSGEVVFLSRNGLYLLAAGAGSVPQPLSRQRLPNTLLNIDLSSVQVSMVFDTEFQGVHIFLRKLNVAQTHYFMDWDSKSFWPTKFVSFGLDPLAVHRYSAAGSDDEKVTLACKDGWIRQFVKERRTDQGASTTEYDINSYITLGPFQPGGDPFREGLLTQIDASPDIDKDGDPNTMTWEVFVGESHEKVIENAVAAALPYNGSGVLPDNSDDDITVAATVSASGMWDDGMNYRERPRTRGVSMLIRLASKGLWSFELLKVWFKRAGQQRKA